MKRSIFALLLGVILLVGCSTTTPLKQYAQVQEVYITTVSILIDARISGDISAEDWDNHVFPVIETGDILLDTYFEQVQFELDTTNTTRTLREVLVQLQQFVNVFVDNE